MERMELHIHLGRRKRCGHRVQGRHLRQTPDAVGGAASQLGARALGLAKKAEPTYEKPVVRISGPPSVTPDETGLER
jgi:hypothetical protein